MTQQVIVRQGASAVEVKRNTGPIRVVGKTPAGAGSLLAANNLSDLGNTTTAQQNLGVRETLTANRTYYVNASTGSDSNDGLSSGNAFATLQKAADVIWGTLDLYGFDVTVDIANGTYTSNLALSGRLTGKGTVTFSGDTTTPSNVLISTSGHCIDAGEAAEVTVEGVKFTSSANGAIFCESAIVHVREVDFGTVDDRHMDARRGGTIFCDTNYSITGGGKNHFYAVEMGMIVAGGRTVTITGTLNFSNAFTFGQNLSYLRCNAMTFSGDAASTTGTEYLIQKISACNIGGATVSGYFPGDSAGSTSDGGIIG